VSEDELCELGADLGSNASLILRRCDHICAHRQKLSAGQIRVCDGNKYLGLRYINKCGKTTIVV
jgi:hypothetical protein